MTRETRRGLVLFAAAIVIGLYLGDLVTAYFYEPDATVRGALRRTRVARSRGREPDLRQRGDVVLDMRDSGIDAWFSLPASAMRTSKIGDTSLLPLATTGGVLTVLCNETGEVETFVADEHGFRNPTGIWSVPRLDIAMIGDSYVQGQCVTEDEMFASLVRMRFPATASVGVGSAGPLTMLGFLREYAARLRPRVVFWFYYEGNDLFDLEGERTVPILMRYLEAGYSQNLAANQERVDARLREYATQITKRRPPQPKVSFGRKVIEWAKLWHLRQVIRSLLPPPSTCCDLALHEKVLRRASEDVKGWGGQFVVVNLAAFASLEFTRESNWLPLTAWDSVKASINRLGLPLIDLRDSLPARGPTQKWYPSLAGHYGAEGNRAIAEILLNYLENSGVRPSPATPVSTSR